MKYCCAINCNKKAAKGSGVSFHKFPKDKELLKKWVVAVRRQHFTPSQYSVVCSAHFRSDCFYSGYVNRPQLKENAVPSIFNLPQHLVKIVNPRRTLKKHFPATVADSSQAVVLVAEPPVVAPEVATADHNYYINGSPRKLQRSAARLEEKNEKLKRVRRKFFKVRQRINRIDKKLRTVTNLLQHLKASKKINDSLYGILESAFGDTLCSIFEGKKGEYSEKLKAFSLSLYFHSPAAYRYVRDCFQKKLPHPNTIRRWCNSVDGCPGFTAEAFQAIEDRAGKSPFRLLGVLIFDEMAIKKKVVWDGNQFIGFVDLGGICTEETNEGVEAKEALVLMVNAINASWKITIGYFLINGLTHVEKKHLIVMALRKLSESGIEIIAITFDGLTCNRTAVSEMGACFQVGAKWKTWIAHPVTHERVYAIIDVCHVLKLARNLLAGQQELKSSAGTIKWTHISALHNLQSNEGVALGNKIKKSHIFFNNQKMKVRFACQILSASTASALRYLRDDLQLPQFLYSSATEEYCCVINSLFDIGNSKNPFAKGFKGAITKKNFSYTNNYMTVAENYLKLLEDMSGRPIYLGQKKTVILGFLTMIDAVRGLYADLVESGKLKFLPMYKFSQDHLEMYFSMVRGRLGFNSNPTVVQFKAAYKQLLLKNEIGVKFSGNCLPQDGTALLSWEKAKCTKEAQPDPILFSNNRLEDIEIQETPLDHQYIPLPADLTEYSENIIVYIAGFAVKRLVKKINCSECQCSLLGALNQPNIGFLKLKNSGGLQIPSPSVVQVCRVTEKLIRQLISNGRPVAGELKLKILRNVLLKCTNLFSELIDHVKDNVYPENHIFILIRKVSELYIKIRCHHIAKTNYLESHKHIIRQKLSKAIHFLGQ